MAKKVEEIVRGAGMFQALITLLVEKVKEFGGCMEDIYRLVTPEGSELLGQIARLIVEAGQKARGISKEIVSILRTEIDTNIDPQLPFTGATIKKHNRRGKVVIEKRADGLYIDGQKVVLYRSKRQLDGRTIKGYELRTELDGQPVLSASILDFLLANLEYIPEEWKGKFVFFWGTIYSDSVGRLYVRCLCWRGVGWGGYYGWLDGGWGSGVPAAVRAS